MPLQIGRRCHMLMVMEPPGQITATHLTEFDERPSPTESILFVTEQSNLETFKNNLARNLGAEDIMNMVYIDDDNDEVPIGSDCEFIEAKRIIGEHSARKKYTKLRVDILDKCHPNSDSIESSGCIEDLTLKSLLIATCDGTETSDVNCKIASAQNTPEWFLNYMQQFRQQITSDIISATQNMLKPLYQEQAKLSRFLSQKENTDIFEDITVNLKEFSSTPRAVDKSGIKKSEPEQKHAIDLSMGRVVHSDKEEIQAEKASGKHVSSSQDETEELKSQDASIYVYDSESDTDVSIISGHISFTESDSDNGNVHEDFLFVPMPDCFNDIALHSPDAETGEASKYRSEKDENNFSSIKFSSEPQSESSTIETNNTKGPITSFLLERKNLIKLKPKQQMKNDACFIKNHKQRQIVAVGKPLKAFLKAKRYSRIDDSPSSKKASTKKCEEEDRDIPSKSCEQISNLDLKLGMKPSHLPDVVEMKRIRRKKYTKRDDGEKASAETARLKLRVSCKVTPHQRRSDENSRTNNECSDLVTNNVFEGPSEDASLAEDEVDNYIGDHSYACHQSENIKHRNDSQNASIQQSKTQFTQQWLANQEHTRCSCMCQYTQLLPPYVACTNHLHHSQHPSTQASVVVSDLAKELTTEMTINRELGKFLHIRKEVDKLALIAQKMDTLGKEDSQANINQSAITHQVDDEPVTILPGKLVQLASSAISTACNVIGSLAQPSTHVCQPQPVISANSNRFSRPNN